MFFHNYEIFENLLGFVGVNRLQSSSSPPMDKGAKFWMGWTCNI